MSEHQREAGFLQGLISYHHTAESHKVDEEITRLKGQIRVLRRAVFWMVVLTALAVVGLGYAAMLSVE